MSYTKKTDAFKTLSVRFAIVVVLGLVTGMLWSGASHALSVVSSCDNSDETDCGTSDGGSGGDTGTYSETYPDEETISTAAPQGTKIPCTQALTAIGTNGTVSCLSNSVATGEQDRAPNLFVDGSWLVYQAYKPNKVGLFYSIYNSQAAKELLTNTNASLEYGAPIALSNQKFLTFTYNKATNGSSLMVASSDGSSKQVGTVKGKPQGLSASNNRKNVVFIVSGWATKLTFDTYGKVIATTNFSPPSGRSYVSAVVSDAGQVYAVSRYSDPTRGDYIYLLNTDPTKNQQIIFDAVDRLYEDVKQVYSISSDGRYLVYGATATGYKKRLYFVDMSKAAASYGYFGYEIYNSSGDSYSRVGGAIVPNYHSLLYVRCNADAQGKCIASGGYSLMMRDMDRVGTQDYSIVLATSKIPITPTSITVSSNGLVGFEIAQTYTTDSNSDGVLDTTANYSDVAYYIDWNIYGK